MKIVYNIEKVLYEQEDNNYEPYMTIIDVSQKNKLGEFLSIIKGDNGLQDYVYYLKDDGSIDKIEIEKCIIINEQENEKDF